MPDLNIEVRAQVDQAVRDLGRVTKTTYDLGKANQDAAGALGVFGVSLTQFSNPLTAIASGLKSSIDFTTKWGDTIDEITRITGTSARESSKLAIVLGDVGISTDSLKGAAKALRSQGLVPSLDTLKDLAKQYQAIQDPVARNDFLFKKLGRSGLELSEFLSRDVSELDALGAAAEKSGKIIDEAGIQKAEQYKQSFAQLGDQLDGAKLSVGSFAVEMLNKAIPAGKQYIGIYQALAVKAELATGIIDQNTATVRAAEIAGLSHEEALRKVYAAEMDVTDASDRLRGSVITLTDEILDEKEAAKKLESAMGDLGKIISGELGNANDDYIQKQADLRLKMADTRAEVDKLTAAHGRQVTITHESETSNAELFLAQDKLAKSTIKLQEANIELTENTDPEKQHELAVKVAEAQVSFDNTRGSVEGMGGSIETWTVNNNAKIDEQKAKLKELEDAYAENAQAHEEATARIIFGFIQQRVTADGVQEGEISFLAEIGKAWGIYDETTATALSSVDSALSEHGLNAEAVIKAVGKSIDDLPTYHEIVIRTIVVGGAAGEVGIGPTAAIPAGLDVPVGNQRQHGGPVYPGQSYLVGEAGPEMFMPTSAGQIISNSTYNNTFHLPAADVHTLAREIAGILGAQKDARQRTGG